MKNSLIFFIFLLLASTHGSPAHSLEQVDLEFNGRERFYLIHTPKNYTHDKQWPVVMVFHGGGGEPHSMVRMTGMNEVADKHGFIAVYPAGFGIMKGKLLTWNAGNCCGMAQRLGSDDVSFIANVMDHLIKHYAANPKRFYATGHSNGAMISYRLACDLSDRIAAIAPNGGQIAYPECTPSRPVPTLHLHGTEDQCANYGGASMCGGCFSSFFKGVGFKVKEKKWQCQPVPKATADYAALHGCSGNTTSYLEKGDVNCQQYQECNNNTAVVLCSVDGSGHTWPGGNYAPAICEKRTNSKLCRQWKSQVGEINRDINASEFMWKFFRDKHL